MTEYLFPSIVGLAALGIGLILSRSRPHLSDGPLPAFARISHPIGSPVNETMRMGHPLMPAVEPERSVRVVLSSPFLQR